MGGGAARDGAGAGGYEYTARAGRATPVAECLVLISAAVGAPGVSRGRCDTSFSADIDVARRDIVSVASDLDVAAAVAGCLVLYRTASAAVSSASGECGAVYRYVLHRFRSRKRF